MPEHFLAQHRRGARASSADGAGPDGARVADAGGKRCSEDEETGAGDALMASEGGTAAPGGGGGCGTRAAA
eukprot:9444061-Alexandrium_andersonii.AAC.1